MPPRAPLPRSLHLPTHTTKPTWKAPKPHLAHLHLDTPPPFQNSFKPPQTPQLPSRRQPAYNPGGFGLGGSFKSDSKGKQKAVEDVEAKEGDAEACYVVCRCSGRSQRAILIHPAATSYFTLAQSEPTTSALLQQPFTRIRYSVRNMGYSQCRPFQCHHPPYRSISLFTRRIRR